MSAGSQGGLPPVSAAILTAAKDAAVWALVALGLCFPLIAFRTERDLSLQTVLEARPLLVALIVAAVFLGRLLWRLYAHPTRPRRVLFPPLDLSDHHKVWLPRAGLAVLLLFPFLALLLTGQGGAVKWIDNFGVQILIYVMLAWGLNIVVGLAGLLDLGYVAFYAVGAYAYAIIATYVIPATVPVLGPWAFWICLPIAGILAAFWGLMLGFPVLRLRGDYLAIVTLAFGEIIRLVLINWVDLTNGNVGIQTPRITFFGLPFGSRTGETTFADVFHLPGSTTVHRSIFLYYVILALALLVAFVTQRMRRLPIGRAWEALREDEIACRSLGINTVNTKLTAFAMGALFGGLAGAFFGARQGFVNPRSFEFMESATILAIVVLGGMGSLVGVAVAAVAIIGGIELLRELDWLKSIFGPDFDPGQYRMLIFGFAMVLMMVWRPRGLIASREPSIALHEAKAVSGAHVKEGHG
ncbi:MAG: high-affinity branched-chain amino acid ABC transporter permease LivM [Hyphomicrobium sp.]|uniref:high-affinity branched-chain amino acid ABC transporter permease LivM n=1 Tax=Hyphomicrobium sp. TaxID=82 RepID=UPI0013295083|nr:high-affinity branched-chain amino acid ABC transporter permease LivM [Hyphomicrobium sp.]KAB2940308.1 MAG: high-affinity branched-chain amino acid ABC transporter permease LivM [Hyphomicrobium sp.]MBZ0211124.1 high-affinity branched-chain amino acid ABC transporter permease LivM [Hyphomicrobium sp.]